MKMSASPSIFNDVIGPVMRGPSSSHCAAALRIGRMCRDLMNNELTNIYIEFDNSKWEEILCKIKLWSEIAF